MACRAQAARTDARATRNLRSISLTPHPPNTLARDYTFRDWAAIGLDPMPRYRGADCTPMSTTEKVADLDGIRQRLDQLGVRL